MSRAIFLNMARSQNLEIAILTARLWGIPQAVCDLWTIAANAAH